MVEYPHQLKQKSLQTVTSSGSSQSIDMDPTCPQKRIMVTGANPVHIRFSKGTAVAATTADPKVYPGVLEMFTAVDATFMTYIQSVGASTMDVTEGNGP